MTDSPDLYAIIELMGRQTIAGKVSEYSLGGTFVRVDVPAVGGNVGFTKLFGAQAIYGMTFVDRDVCLAAAEKLGRVPVTVYDLGAVTAEAVKQRLLESTRVDDYDEVPF